MGRRSPARASPWRDRFAMSLTSDLHDAEQHTAVAALLPLGDQADGARHRHILGVAAGATGTAPR